MTTSSDGRSDEFLGVVERHESRIFGFLSRMCRSREDARDALQETFLAAFRTFGDFRGEAKVSTWLYRIAANACLKMRRRRKFEPERELSLEEFMPVGREGQTRDVADWAATPETAALEGELHEALESAIGELPEPYRVVLVLRDVEGLAAEEVGEILGLSVAAVKSRLHRARLYVRQRLDVHFAPQRRR